jgi:hypothetical protein
MLVRYALAIPASVLFIKYLPDYGRYYDRWLFIPCIAASPWTERVGRGRGAGVSGYSGTCWSARKRRRRRRRKPAGR